MAKKFMFVCLGILALVVAFHLGAEYGQAGYVDPSTTGIIAVSSNDMLLDNGEVWRRDIGGWSYLPDYALPVPVSQVKFWEGPSRFYSVSNELWQKGSQFQEWVNYGSPPGLVATEPTTWGEIKAKFTE